MEKAEIQKYCIKKEEELLNKYFGNLVKEAAIGQPETIEGYDKELPLRIEAEYKEFLSELWKEVAGDDKRTIDEIIDKKELREKLTDDDREGIDEAYRNAQQRTLWERLTNTNHKDVTFYKGLLEEYTRELLFCLRHDFLEEI
jgi:hypothetical protein